MDDEEKPRAKVQWIRDPDGKRRRIVTRASVEDAAKALSDPENVPTRTIDTSSDTNIPPDWQAPQNAVFPDDSVYVLKRRKEDMVFDDANPVRLAPMIAEGVIWRLYQLRCWEPGLRDKAALEADLWPFHVTAASIAAQSEEGALDNIAAYRKWEGRTIRDGCRPGQVMSVAEAVEALRLGLEAGLITARRSRAPGAKAIPAEVWLDPDWEKSANGELLEFEKLRGDGKVLYRRPVLVREEVLRLVWTVDGPTIPPELKQIREETEAKAPDTAVATVSKSMPELSQTHDNTLIRSFVDNFPSNVTVDRQVRINKIAAELEPGLIWRKEKSSKTPGEPDKYPFIRALERKFKENVSRDGEAREAWLHHYPYRPGAGRPIGNSS